MGLCCFVTSTTTHLKYIDVQELDRAIANELIEKIVVHQAEKLDGQGKQQLDIYYRFIGKIL